MSSANTSLFPRQEQEKSIAVERKKPSSNEGHVSFGRVD